jgi:hypothetical protein
MMTKLDEIAVNVELVLISLIEGVALVTLAEEIVRAFQEPDWYRFIPYMFAGLSILLVFWAQSLMHAVSFIRWPIRIEHMFTYFAAALLQIIAYANLLHIGTWFFWWTLFSLMAIGMYFIDLWIMQDSRASFAKLKGGLEFLDQVEERHMFEMTYLVPGALAFNVACVIAVLLFPVLFVNVFIYMLPGILQLAFSLYALYDCTVNFRKRSKMIAELFAEKEILKAEDKLLAVKEEIIMSSMKYEPRVERKVEEQKIEAVPETPKIEESIIETPVVETPKFEAPKAHTKAARKKKK